MGGGGGASAFGKSGGIGGGAGGTYTASNGISGTVNTGGGGGGAGTIFSTGRIRDSLLYSEAKTIVKQLPGTMFATSAITLSDPKELDAAIVELKALLADKSTVLGSIEIESSASGDRPTEDKKSGYPDGTTPGKYPLGKPYVVKTGETSGNAKLALGRGETIKQKLAGLSDKITVKAVIQDGGDAAQYAKLIVTAKKAGGASEVYTTDELKNLVLKTKQTKDLASVNTLSVWKAASGSSYGD
jgi:hypothetical protein